MEAFRGSPPTGLGSIWASMYVDCWMAMPVVTARRLHDDREIRLSPGPPLRWLG